MSSATTSSCAWLAAAAASAASTRASASSRASCAVMRPCLSQARRYAALLQRTRLPARCVERCARLLVCEALLDGVEADARAVQLRQPGDVRDQPTAQSALSGARQAADSQQAGLRLRHALQHGAAAARQRAKPPARAAQAMHSAAARLCAHVLARGSGWQVEPACTRGCAACRTTLVGRSGRHTCARPRALSGGLAGPLWKGARASRNTPLSANGVAPCGASAAQRLLFQPRAVERRRAAGACACAAAQHARVCTCRVRRGLRRICARCRFLHADAAVPPAQSRLLGQLRPFNATAAARGGAGLPVERGPPETREARARAPPRAPAAPPRGPPPQRSRLSRVARPQVPEHDELRWDDGSKNPEMVLDDPAPQLTPVRAAAQRQRVCRVARLRGPRHRVGLGLKPQQAH